MDPVPVMVLGDAPDRETGLARIARDLTARLHAVSDSLGIRVAQIGLRSDMGTRCPVGLPWPCFITDDWDTWAARDLADIWRTWTRDAFGVLLTIWDPARCHALTRVPIYGVRWGYFAIDAWNVERTIGGPAAEAVRGYDRVLAYGRWGSEVLRPVVGHAVPYLPHGIDLNIFNPDARMSPYTQWLQREWRLKPGDLLVGCVASNQPRKDFGLLFDAWRLLAGEEPTLRCWLHTDNEVAPAWSVPQLAEDFGLSKRLIVSTSLPNEALAAAYSLCAATIAPGLGEGFGYPIVESLACGTPVVHGRYGGGIDLMPVRGWQFEPRAWRLESCYALARPVYHAEDVVTCLTRAIDWRRNDRQTVEAYCHGAVGHLDWPTLWPWWQSWIVQGLREIRS